jgi:hypothetical protein
LREVLPFCAAQGLPHRLPENYLVRVERETSRCLLSGQLEIGTAFPPLPELLNRFIATFLRLAELLNLSSCSRFNPPCVNSPIAPDIQSQVLGNCASQETPMLWTVFAILLLLWLLGWGFHVAGSLIHLILVIALVVLVIELITGRRATV